MENFYFSKDHEKLIHELDRNLIKYGGDLSPKEIVSAILLWSYYITFDICPSDKEAEKNIKIIFNFVKATRSEINFLQVQNKNIN